MPPPDTMYCAQQIHIPPDLPDILKQFTKAAIRTQPEDVLKWAAAYFTALSKGEALPVKERLESSSAETSGLTPALLKVLHKQLCLKQPLYRSELQDKWRGFCLPLDQLDSLISLGNFLDVIDWMPFFATACSSLGGSITSALKHACEILSEDPEGSAARVPLDTIVQIYTKLAQLDGDIPQDQIDSFVGSLREAAAQQDGMVQVSNFYNL